MTTAKATVSMWKRRIDRLSNAWNDPDSGREPIGYDRVFWFLIFLEACYIVWRFSTIMANGQFVTELAFFLIGWTVVWRLAWQWTRGWPSAIHDIDHSAAAMGPWIIFCFVGGVALGIASNVHVASPATPEEFKEAKAADPTCTRYVDWLTWRLERKELLSVGDIETAKQECVDGRRHDRIAKEQRALLK